jgi:hypothetical protein
VVTSTEHGRQLIVKQLGVPPMFGRCHHGMRATSVVGRQRRVVTADLGRPIIGL